MMHVSNTHFHMDEEIELNRIEVNLMARILMSGLTLNLRLSVV